MCKQHTIFYQENIREKITPRGDGNQFLNFLMLYLLLNTRKDNSERRRKPDFPDNSINSSKSLNTRKDNSERRRKLFYLLNIIHFLSFIREKITPRGDGNLENYQREWLEELGVDTRKDNSERRRKLLIKI